MCFHICPDDEQAYIQHRVSDVDGARVNPVFLYGVIISQIPICILCLFNYIPPVQNQGYLQVVALFYNICWLMKQIKINGCPTLSLLLQRVYQT